jgi:hypothetical protein
MSNPLQNGMSSSERAGLVVTNLTKLAGVVITLTEVFGRNETRPEVLGIAALMIAGAQGVENLLKGVLGK